MRSGGDLPGADILVHNGRITEIGLGFGVPAGAEVIMAAGCVVLPGFVDVHTHGSISQMRGLYGNTPETAFYPVTNPSRPTTSRRTIMLACF